MSKACLVLACHLSWHSLKVNPPGSSWGQTKSWTNDINESTSVSHPYNSVFIMKPLQLLIMKPLQHMSEVMGWDEVTSLLWFVLIVHTVHGCIVLSLYMKASVLQFEVYSIPSNSLCLRALQAHAHLFWLIIPKLIFCRHLFYTSFEAPLHFVHKITKCDPYFRDNEWCTVGRRLCWESW